MNKFIKSTLYTCPKCGSEDTDVTDYEFDIDCLSLKVTCNECDASWIDYALLKYDGYYDREKGVMYDADGKRCSD